MTGKIKLVPVLDLQVGMSVLAPGGDIYGIFNLSDKDVSNYDFEYNTFKQMCCVVRSEGQVICHKIPSVWWLYLINKTGTDMFMDIIDNVAYPYPNKISKEMDSLWVAFCSGYELGKGDIFLPNESIIEFTKFLESLP